MQLHRPLVAFAITITLFAVAGVCHGQGAAMIPASRNDNLYPPNADAHAEVQQALQKAAKKHKHLLIVFGANWCYDCHVLDRELQSPQVAPTLTANYEVVNVDVGRGGKNRDLLDQYEVSTQHGIPALAVLDSEGKILFSQKHSEFVDARKLTPEDILEFLNKWKP